MKSQETCLLFNCFKHACVHVEVWYIFPSLTQRKQLLFIYCWAELRKALIKLVVEWSQLLAVWQGFLTWGAKPTGTQPLTPKVRFLSAQLTSALPPLAIIAFWFYQHLPITHLSSKETYSSLHWPKLAWPHVPAQHCTGYHRPSNNVSSILFKY